MWSGIAINDQQLKEINVYPQMTQMEVRRRTVFGERELSRIDRELKEMGSQADGVGEQQLSKIGQQLKENVCVPWMISSPNKKCNQI